MNDALWDLLVIGQARTVTVRATNELGFPCAATSRYRLVRCDVRCDEGDYSFWSTCFAVADTIGMERKDGNRFFFRHGGEQPPLVFFSPDGRHAAEACRSLNHDQPPARHLFGGLYEGDTTHD
jgi:hypothetical protein